MMQTSLRPAPCSDLVTSLRKLNCLLVEAQLHSGTPAYPGSADELATALFARRHLLTPVVARFAAPLAPEEAMAEILPDLLARIEAGTVHWFTLRYLKTAVQIRARQFRRDGKAHRSLDDSSVPELRSRPAGPPAGEFTEQEVRCIYRRFLAGLSREHRLLLRLARRMGRSTDGDRPGHRQGWQKAIALRLGRPPCWVTRHLDNLFQRLAGTLGRSDLKCRKRKRSAN